MTEKLETISSIGKIYLEKIPIRNPTKNFQIEIRKKYDYDE